MACIYDEPLEPYICEADWNCKDCPNWVKRKKKMNVEIDNAEIEKIIDRKINERVQAWFEESEHKYYIRDAVLEAVDTEVCKRVNESKIDIPKVASSLASKKLAEEIAENIGYTIARIFEENYRY